MTEDVASCQPTDQVSDIWAIMKERRLKSIPVTDAASVPIGTLTHETPFRRGEQKSNRRKRSATM